MEQKNIFIANILDSKKTRTIVVLVFYIVFC